MRPHHVWQNLRSRLPSWGEVRGQWRRSELTFGRADWFRLRTRGWGLHPVHWLGWAYGVAWIAATAMPFAALLLSARVPEAAIWLAIGLSFFLRDVRHVRRVLLARRGYGRGPRDRSETAGSGEHAVA